MERRSLKTSKKKTIECPKCEEDFEARSMLDGIWVESAEQRLEQVIYNVTVKGDRNLIVGGDIAGKVHTGDIYAELTELTELVQREFTKVFNALQAMPDVCCPNVFVLRGSTREGDITGLLEPIRSPGMMDRIRESVWKQHLELQLYCQQHGFWHPLGYERGRNDPATGLYQIEVSSDFLGTIAPYLVKMSGMLKFAQPVVGPFVSWADPARYEKQFKDDIERMKNLAEGMSKSLASIEEAREAKMAASFRNDDNPQRAEGAALRALRLLLEEKDKERVWGRLRRLMTKEGNWLWLCEHHAAEYRD